MAEETGYRVEVRRLLGVDSRDHHVDWGGPTGTDLHRVAVLYDVAVTGGELRNEQAGSTDRAEWVAVEDIPRRERTIAVDVGLDLLHGQPPTGHLDPVPVGGLLRY